MKKIIIFCGGFDPIHLGHVHMAEVACKSLDSDVIFVPARVSIWKESRKTSSEDKAQMVKLAIKHQKRFYFSDYELNSSKEYNYSIDTVKHFQKAYKGYQIYFLIGGDQVSSFHLWKNAKEISEIVQIVYFKRPNISIENENVKNYHMIEIVGDEFEASSTDVVSFKNIPLCYEVIKYIESHNLYYMDRIHGYFNNEKRYQHCLSVANLAYQIAVSNGVKEPYKAYQAGLLHDVGKAVKGNEALTIMENYFSDYIDIGEFAFHQFIGRYIAENDFKIDDSSVLNAIEFHATGFGNMDDLGKIIFVADKADPLRNVESSKIVVDSIMKSIEEGFKNCLQINREYLSSSGKDSDNSLTNSCYNTYLR